MLSSMLSTLSTTTSVISMFSTIGVSDVSIITVVCLIALLSASEILSASKLWNRQLAARLNSAIIPMVLTFFLIVIYKVMDVLAH